MDKKLGVFAIGLVAGSLIAGGIYLTLATSDSSNQLVPQQEAQPTSAATSVEFGVVLPGFIVGFVGQPDIAAIRAVGGRDIQQLSLINAIAVNLPGHAAENLQKNPNIEYVEPDLEISSFQELEALCRPGSKGWVHCPDRVKADRAPKQPVQTPSNGVLAVGVDTAVALNAPGAGVGIVSFDSGIEADHPDLAANIPTNNCLADFSADRTKSCEDLNGHGTLLAGVMVADYNSIGIYGIANDAQLYSAKVLSQTGRGFISDVILALDSVIKAKVTNPSLGVINMSFGTDGDSFAFHSALIKAYDAGFVLVGAAGNDPTIQVRFPARYPEVIAVSALDQNTNTIASFSAIGPEIELTAPAVLVNTTYWGWGYINANGTSIAAPHVSAMAALIIGAGLAETPNQVRQELATSAQDLGLDSYEQGAGLVYVPGLVRLVE